MKLNLHHLMYFYEVVQAGGISKAAARLKVSQPTISAQLLALEQAVGAKLLDRGKSGTKLTEVGSRIFEYAEDVAKIGGELEQFIATGSSHKPVTFRVGIADAVPKILAQRVLSPILKSFPELSLSCNEGSLEQLVGKMVAHDLDLVLSDALMPPGGAVKVYHKELLTSSTSFYCTAALKRELKGKFPECLGECALILPSKEAGLRQRIDTWLKRRGLAPKVVHDCDDRALIHAFGQQGHGVFPAPSLLGNFLNIECLGNVPEIEETLYALSLDRKFSHPALELI
jgi:LysR family transcriptional regulator, transcriptional activator of nhaA